MTIVVEEGRTEAPEDHISTNSDRDEEYGGIDVHSCERCDYSTSSQQ
jgi:hypothetical protein